jgi:predicted nucleic acid-binding protein
MIKVLLDTNVVLDLLLDREGFAEAAASIWDAHCRNEVEAYIAAITPINTFFIARKLKGADLAREYVSKLLGTLKICPLDHQSLLAAEILSLPDYEDSVQVASAMFNNLDAIITRDPKDFKNSPLPVYSPTDFLQNLRSNPLA